MVIAARAKINLWLRVGKLRGDGFHEIETLMVPLSLADELAIALTDGAWEFSCEGGGGEVPQDESNLAVRAARSWAQAAGYVGGVTIRLQKNIPSGAGLGGGSSDAAAVLRALQKMQPGLLPAERLHALAAGLGSDVPFFLQDGAAICRGRGEKVRPVESPWHGVLLLVKPPFGVPTGWAYSALDQFRARQAWQPPEGEARCWENDFAGPVLRKYRVLADLQGWLLGRPGVEAVVLAGSGSTMAAACAGVEEARALAAAVRGEFGETFWCEVTRTVGQMATG
jgi:4-diphosphocytidyl-2-C-methyl-D-erythritol kinase